MTRKYSETEIGTYLTCPQLYRHRYIKRIQPRKKPIYFIVGSAVHKFLEIYYATRGRQVEVGLNNAKSEFDSVDTSLYTDEEVHDLECQRAMALGICEAYPLYYDQDFDEFEEFLTETDHSISIDNGHGDSYRARIDVLAKDAAGDWWIIETKTASRVDADYFTRVAIDRQVLGQAWVAKSALGGFPRGVIYNAIVKTKIRLRRGESKTSFQQRVKKEYGKGIADAKHYFHRERIIFDKRHLEQWMKNTEFYTGMLSTRRNVKSQLWPENTISCSGKWGSSCAFLEACTSRSYNRLLYERMK